MYKRAILFGLTAIQCCATFVFPSRAISFNFVPCIQSLMAAVGTPSCSALLLGVFLYQESPLSAVSAISLRGGRRGKSR